MITRLKPVTGKINIQSLPETKLGLLTKNTHKICKFLTHTFTVVVLPR